MSKVMLIDDDVMVVDLLETLLDLEGFDVITYSMGEDIVESIQSHKPDVILMDVYLRTSPGDGEDGLNLLAQIRENPDLSDTRVIMSSGIDFHIESKESGADGFLLKPYMPEELIDLIKQVL
ncbi:MAG: response regulator [Anaerolineales bacterium]|nr:response regulator [Chloroflexota bacterium]MBL7161295.1 response regulator [Anaerolineales bacterium]